MKRRKFIRNVGLGAAASLFPTILPAGTVFAKTGARKVNHVVFCLFAGGVRNLESVQKADGNLMPYTLIGNESISPDIAPGMSPFPPNNGTTLQEIGTLFKEFRYAQGPTGHYNAHSTAITGQYVLENVQIKEPPKTPTVFELYRKHNSPGQTANKVWWVTDSLGPYPYLNYSSYPGYGPSFGANTIQSLSIFNPDVFQVLGDPVSFHSSEMQKVDRVREFLDGQFKKPQGVLDTGVRNTPEDREAISAWLQQMLSEANSGQHLNPWGVGAMNGDMYNAFYATQILDAFEPELLVVNMQGIDICHTDFTRYCNQIRRADFALNKLWEFIQNHPILANDTVLIVAPEHGRNQQPNTIIDAYGRYAVDHTSDAMSREIFCLVAGPAGVVNRNQVISQVTGESIDIVPTIANVLGFDVDIPGGLLPGRVLNEAFV